MCFGYHDLDSLASISKGDEPTNRTLSTEDNEGSLFSVEYEFSSTWKANYWNQVRHLQPISLMCDFLRCLAIHKVYTHSNELAEIGMFISV